MLGGLDFARRLASGPLVDGLADAVARPLGMSIAPMRFGGPMRLGKRLLVIEIVVTRDIAGKFRPLQFGVEFADHPLLNHLAAAGVDRVRDVGVELSPAIFILDRPVFLQSNPALVAISGLEVVFTSALNAMGGQLAARHGHKRAVRPFDDLQIPDHEAIVKGD